MLVMLFSKFYTAFLALPAVPSLARMPSAYHTKTYKVACHYQFFLPISIQIHMSKTAIQYDSNDF